MTATVSMSLSSTSFVSTANTKRQITTKTYTRNMTSLDSTLVHDSLRGVLNDLMLPSSRTEIINGDCIPAIVKAMKLHPTSNSVQTVACLLVERMAEIQESCPDPAHTHQGSRLQQALIENRVSSVLVEAMSTFPLSLNIQQSAIETLKSLAAVKGFNETIQELDIVSAIVNAMKKHSVVECIQRSSMEALTVLADSYACKITESGGAEATVVAMSQYSDNPGVQARACLALGTLVNKHPKGQEKIVDAGGIEAILAATSTHMETANVLIEVFGALEKFASAQPEYADRITEAGGIQLIMEAVKKHPDSARLHNGARNVLMALTQTD